MAGAGESSQQAAPGPSQMPAVFVKNTFLDLDDGLRMPELQRWKSTPNPVSTPLDEEEDEDEEAEGEETPEADGEPSIPVPPDLYRMQTVDGYEPVNEWTWLGGDPNQLGGEPHFGGAFGGTFMGGADFPPCAALGEVPPALAPLGPEAQLPPPGAVGGVQPPVFGMVMVPAEAMQGAAMAPPFGAMGAMVGPPPPFIMPGMPADCVAVPVARFTRWPEAMPQMAAPPEDGQLPPAPAPTPMPASPAGASPDPAATPEPPAASSAPAADEGAAEGGEPGAAPAIVPAMPRAPVLQRTFSVPSSLDRIRWTVDARKLKSTDREAVSPMFELSFSKIVNFKILIRPKVISSVRGGASFKKAKGKGSVELRCLDEVTAAMNPVVTFRISVGSGTDPSRQEPPRGPVKHDFTKKAICGLGAGQEEWDFSKAVDEATQTFVVCLEVLAGTSAA